MGGQIEDSPAATTANRMIRGCRHLLAKNGIRSTTLRKLANELGVTASAISYHFGGKEHLLAAVFRDALKRRQRWLDDSLTMVRDFVGGPDTLAALLHTHVVGQDEEQRIDFKIGAALADASRTDGALAEAATQWRSAGTAYWRALLADHVDDPAIAGLACRAFIDAERRYTAGEPNSVQPILSHARCRRLAHRLLGFTEDNSRDTDPLATARARFSQVDWTPRAPNAEPPEPRHGPREAILRAAIDVIAEEGATAATHRRIAERAQVSLSSTTYHFASLSQIVHEAFAYMVSDLVGILLPVAKTGVGPPPSSLDMISTFSRVCTEPPDRLARALNAIDAVANSAGSGGIYTDLLLEFSLARGVFTHQWLQSVTDLKPEPDTMDAHVFDTILDGLFSSLRRSDIGDPDDAYRVIHWCYSMMFRWSG